jgi:hypothetical protein
MHKFLFYSFKTFKLFYICILKNQTLFYNFIINGWRSNSFLILKKYFFKLSLKNKKSTSGRILQIFKYKKFIMSSNQIGYTIVNLTRLGKLICNLKYISGWLLIKIEGELTWCDLQPSQSMENLVKIHWIFLNFF